MKKLIFNLFLVSLLVLTTFNCYGEERKTYTGSGSYFSYSIDYPSNWQPIDMYGFVKFMAPPANKTDDFRESVMLTVADLSKKPMSLEQFSSMWLTIVPQELSNFKLLDKGESVIDGKNTLFYVYKGNKDRKSLKCKRYTLIINSNIYELLYEAKEEDFNKYLPQAESIMKSIKVEK